jgi:hypothetical protein
MLAALYWGPRKETRMASLMCWQKTRSLLGQAGLHNEAFHDDASDVDKGEDSPQTGFRYSWKSPGKLPEQLSLHVLCGAWASASNAVLLNVPDRGTYCFEKKAKEYLWAFSELIEVWDPLEGIVCRHEDVAWTGARLSEALPCVKRYRRGNTRVCLDSAWPVPLRDLNSSH